MRTLSPANLRNLPLDQLLSLRQNLDDILKTRIIRERKALESQLSALDAYERESVAPVPVARKNSKVAPKYKGPQGELWAGRGLRPRWLEKLISEGHKLDEYLIGARTRAVRGRRR